jgi:hypothetical protein
MEEAAVASNSCSHGRGGGCVAFPAPHPLQPNSLIRSVGAVLLPVGFGSGLVVACYRVTLTHGWCRVSRAVSYGSFARTTKA